MGRHSLTEDHDTSPLHPGSPENQDIDPRPIEQRDVPAAPLWRSRLAVSAVLVLVLVAGTWWLFRWLQEPAGTSVTQEIELPAGENPDAEPVTSTAQGSPAAEVIVHVAGEVAEPGIVELPEGARVVDALDAAGGPLDAADLSRLNLAAVVADGEQIMVPGEGEAGEGSEGHHDPAAPVAPGGNAAGGAGSPVNLNTADGTLLQRLPGVGPALSERIIAHRETVGPFTSMTDLDAVSGIGPAMMEKLEGLVSW